MRNQNTGGMWTDTAGAWLAIITGIIGAVATGYGCYREWQQRRQNQSQRLLNAATAAVRRAESCVVRPILGDRMIECVLSCVPRHSHEDPVRFRTLLFADLHRQARIGVRSADVDSTVFVSRTTKNAWRARRP